MLPVIVLLAVLASPLAEGLNTDEQNQITTGLEFGKSVAELLESKQFTQSLAKIAKNIGPYLGAIGPFAGLVMAFIPVEDPVMNMLKDIMANIDNKFDRLDNRFNDVERLIDWNAVRVNFGQLEQKILAMSQRYKYLYGVPKSGVNSASKNFIENYPSTFENSGTKLYQAIIHKQGVFQENLATSVMRYTKNDRRKTQEFLMGVMKLYLQAVKMELSYYALQQQDTLMKYMKGVLENHVKEVQRNFEAADRTCRDRYHSQLLTDINEYAADHPKSSQSNKDFVKALFQFISGKYYWRHWFVAAYNPISGSDNHWVQVCSGHIRFRVHGRNFIVASKDRYSGRMDLARAERDMKSVATTERKGNWFTGYYTARRTAQAIYNSLNKSGACSVGVIRCGNDLWYYYHSYRFKYVNRCPNFNLHMWG